VPLERRLYVTSRFSLLPGRPAHSPYEKQRTHVNVYLVDARHRVLVRIDFERRLASIALDRIAALHAFHESLDRLAPETPSASAAAE